MISHTLLTIALLTTIGSTDVITPDELPISDGVLVRVHGRCGDRIGERIKLEGFEGSVILSRHIKLPRRGRKERPTLLDMRLLREVDGWRLVAVHPLDSWKNCVELHSLRASNLGEERQQKVCQFLMRESSPTTREKLWLELETLAGGPRHWLQIGSQFLSEKQQFASAIESRGLEDLAVEVGLYRKDQLWISRADYLTSKGLQQIDGVTRVTRRINLEKEISNKIDHALTLSRNEPLGNTIRSGTLRHAVRALRGDPTEVTWLTIQSHFVEEWVYGDQVIRLINGRVFEVLDESLHTSR